jgi:hypothetical protein
MTLPVNPPNDQLALRTAHSPINDEDDNSLIADSKRAKAYLPTNSFANIEKKPTST